MNPKQIEERILKAFELVSGREKRKSTFLSKIEFKILVLLQTIKPQTKPAG